MKANRFLVSVLAGGATVAALSCADSGPFGPRFLASMQGAPPGLLVDSLVRSASLLWCSALPYDSVTATIGPAGGTLQVGPHALSVPSGALDAPVTITAVAPSDTANHVRLRPEGLTFRRPASLRLSYANCDLLGVPLPKRIVYTTDSLVTLEYVPSVDDAASQTVAGQLKHFSDYAVAW